jgi:hypothetical protein
LSDHGSIAEAFASAVAAKLAGHPEVALKAADFLTEQTQLLQGGAHEI